MSGGPKRQADKINTMGIVMIGICGAVLVYVSIAALQAFYANDVADVQTMADYGGQDISAKDLKAAQIGNITNVGKTGKGSGGEQLYQIKITDGMTAVLKSVAGDKQAGVAADPTNLVPSVGTQTTPTIQPLYGRPKQLKPAPTPPPTQTDGSAAPGTGSGSGSAAPGAGSGSAAAIGPAGSAAPLTPTDTATQNPTDKAKPDHKKTESKGDKH